MTDQQPRLPLWRVMNAAQMALGHPSPEEMLYVDAISAMRAIRAAEIRAVRDYLINHSTLDENTMDLLGYEAQRAEAGE